MKGTAMKKKPKADPENYIGRVMEIQRNQRLERIAAFNAEFGTPAATFEADEVTFGAWVTADGVTTAMRRRDGSFDPLYSTHYPAELIRTLSAVLTGK